MNQTRSRPLSPLTAIAACDGRYFDKTENLHLLFSEYGLMRHRIAVELAWIQKLATLDAFSAIPALSENAIKALDAITTNFDLKAAQRIKEIEATTHHDVKAVEYYLRECFEKTPELKHIQHLIHFACTSEDINNIAWRKIIQEARTGILLTFYRRINQTLQSLAEQYADLALLARTHGQPASPSTLGKEFRNFSSRLRRQIKLLEQIPITAKFNGAVGNFNAHTIACPEIDWPLVSTEFIQSFSLTPTLHTTQIEPNDTLAEILHCIIRINRILVDLSQDAWLYMSRDLLKQKVQSTEVGSSTMPHKVNPIDFENAEGNFGIANALAGYFAEKLTVSRLQRDLTDSTTLRSLGLVFAHTLIALQALDKGMNKTIPDSDNIKAELEQHWEVLTEAIQTTMRRYNIPSAYEQMKVFSRGKSISPQALHEFINQLDVPAEAKERLLKLTPGTYTGMAQQLARQTTDS